MKKIIAMALVVICFCGLVGCSQKNDEVLHLGLNATVVEIDTSNHILYVTDLGNDEIFGDRCGIDCNEAIFAMSTMMLKMMLERLNLRISKSVMM